MKAVFLSYYYPPLKAPRAVQVARLSKYCRQPIRVLCAAAGAVPTRPGVEVEIFPDQPRRWWHPAKHLIYLPDPQRPWARHVARQALDRGLLAKDDVLVTFGQPMSDHLAGLYLKQRIGMPWIAHFSDPWSDNPYLLPIPFSRRRLRAMERRVFEAADRLLFTSAETVDLVMAKYPAAVRGKARVLPHAYDPDLYGDPPIPRASGAPLCIRYLGNFYRQRNPLLFEEALRLLWQERPDLLENVRIELIGRWVGHSDWSPTTQKLPKGLLTMHKFVDYEASLRLMRQADALLIIDAPFEHNVFFPSKLVDYLGAGRPILALTPPGTTADIVAASGGLVAAVNSMESIADGVVRLITGLRQGNLEPSSAPAIQQYEARTVAATFDSLLDEAGGTGWSGR